MCISRISSLQRWRLGGIYSSLEKISRFIVVAIPDTSGMTYTAPTVTKYSDVVRHRNSWWMPKLPTVGTLDSCQNSRPSRLLKTSRWPLPSIPDTSGMTTTVNSPSQLKRETSKLPTIAGTPDEPTREQQFYDCWANTGHARYCQTSKKSVSSFVSQILKTHMGWLKHLWMIIFQHDASLLIVRHTY